MSRPEDMEPSPFGSKEDQWPKFREDLMDFADAVHPTLKGQLEYTLRQKEEVTSFSMRSNPLRQYRIGLGAPARGLQAPQAENRGHDGRQEDRRMC